METKSRQFVEALSRGIGVLRILSHSPTPLSLSELAKASRLSISTIQRLTYTLQELGMIARESHTKQFRIGPQFITMAFHAIENLEIKKVAHPVMVLLSEEINEVVGLGALSGGDIILLDIIIKTQQILNINLSPGDTLPLNATASGKVILAFLPEDEADAILNKFQMTGLTSQTITSTASLKAQLKEVRSQGFATACDEGTYGLTTIAAPVRNHSGEVVATLAIMVPSVRVEKDTLVITYKDKVLETAERISSALGFQG